MQSVGEQLGIGNLEDFRPHSALVSACAVGVELELEGFTSRSTTEAQSHLHPLWSVTTDGSLRNGGVELITNGGLGGERLYAAFERVASLLERINYDASWRCSTHMHINMRDFTVNQVARFMMVYAACEPVIFAHCGAFRYSSNFCVPLADSLPFHKKLIARMWDDVISTRLAASATVKYTAMNFQPLFGDGRGRPALGTVEFRGGRPMTTVDDFVLQANLLLSIKEFVKNSTDTEAEMLTRLNEGVLSTVYHTGCAAALDVNQSILDEALVHSWMLLKSYQRGMKSPAPQKKSSNTFSAAAEEALASLRRTPSGQAVVERLSPEQIERLGYWNAGDMRYGDTVQGTGGDPDTSRWREAVTAWTNPETSLKDQAIILARVLRTDFRISEDHACITAARWYMNTLDSQSRNQASPKPWLICRRQKQANTQGIPYWVLADTNYQRQPRFTWGAANFNYLQEVHLNAGRQDLIRMTGASRNSVIFDFILNTNVRVKGQRVLFERIMELGIPTNTLIETNKCQAAYLIYLLRYAGLRSVDHVHAQDLSAYDRVDACVNILLEHGMSVPFFKHWINSGRGIIRCESSISSPMGHAQIQINRLANPPQRRGRESETTGFMVY